MTTFRNLLLASAMTAFCAPAFAVPQELYVYPASGQDNATLEKDRYECYVWATGESSFDPAREESIEPTRVVQVPVGDNPQEGAAAKGTLLGAIAGVAIGDSHEGAAVGAVVGTIAGAIMESEGERIAEAEAQQEAEAILQRDAELAGRYANYTRAFSACLEGRGYVVR